MAAFIIYIVFKYLYMYSNDALDTIKPNAFEMRSKPP